MIVQDDESYFALNTNFKHKKVKFKIAGGGSTSAAQNSKESAETRKAVLEDRKLFLQV